MKLKESNYDLDLPAFVVSPCGSAVTFNLVSFFKDLRHLCMHLHLLRIINRRYVAVLNRDDATDYHIDANMSPFFPKQGTCLICVKTDGEVYKERYDGEVYKERYLIGANTIGLIVG